MGEWGYGVGEREGCYGSCRGGTGLCVEGFGMLLGWEWRGEGWWMGGCDGRDSIYFPLCTHFFLLFRKLGRWGGGKPRG